MMTFLYGKHITNTAVATMKTKLVILLDTDVTYMNVSYLGVACHVIDSSPRGSGLQGWWRRRLYIGEISDLSIADHLVQLDKLIV